MIDKNAAQYIEESRTQARRDLDSAKLLLSTPDPHLENVAFLLEQSYEKILKAAYVNYRLYTTSDSWKTIYKKTLVHDIGFMFDMLRDIHEYYANLVTQNAEKYGSLIKSFNMFPDSINKIITSPEKFRNEIIAEIANIERAVNHAIKNKERFVDFVSKLNSKSIKETNIKRTEIPDYLNGLDDFKRMMPNLNNSILNTKALQKYISFLNMLKALAPCTLPHAIASRYPIMKCKMKNLEVYRTAPNLKDFFGTLAYKTQTLLDSESDFTRYLIRTHSASSNMSNLH